MPLKRRPGDPPLPTAHPRVIYWTVQSPNEQDGRDVGEWSANGLTSHKPGGRSERRRIGHGMGWRVGQLPFIG